MKITLKSLIYFLLFICFCNTVKAQSLADTLRISVAANAAVVNGIFGTGVNVTSGGTPSTAFTNGAGIALHLDIPIIEQFNASVSAGYDYYFKSQYAVNSEQAISGTTTPNLQTIPIKLGIKWFIGKRFYVHGEVGETFFANRTALYGVYSSSLTYSPGIGLLIPLKKHRFVDAGFRFEGFQSFYNDGLMNTFFAVHIAYGLRL